MDIKAIITSNLPDGVEITDAQIGSIAKAIQAEQGKEFVPKDDYRKKVERIDELETQVKESGSSAADADAYKQQVKDLKAEIKRIQTSHEAEKLIDSKRKALHKQLQAEGANPKLVDLLESKFNLDNLDLDGDTIKDWETHATPVKEQYSELFGKVQTQGVDVPTPPTAIGNAGKSTSPAQEIANLNAHRIALP